MKKVKCYKVIFTKSNRKITVDKSHVYEFTEKLFGDKFCAPNPDTFVRDFSRGRVEWYNEIEYYADDKDIIKAQEIMNYFTLYYTYVYCLMQTDDMVEDKHLLKEAGKLFKAVERGKYNKYIGTEQAKSLTEMVYALMS